MATNLYIQTVSEANLASDTKALESGTLTFSERAIYLGIGGKKVQYLGGSSGSGGQVTADALQWIGSFASDDEAKQQNKDNALFYNSTDGALKVLVGSQVTTIITGGVSVRDLEAIKTQLNAKANSADVYTKKEVYNKTEADKIAQDSKTEVETIVTTKVTEEKTRAEGVETQIKAELDAKTKAVYHKANIALKANDFVIHANKVYLVKEAFTTTDNFDTDKAKLFDLAESMSSSFSLVEYADNTPVSIHSGQQVLKDGKLYVCKVDIEATSTWDVDKTNMVDLGSTIDLTDYYNKAATDALLKQKMNVITPGAGLKVEQLDDKVKMSADMSKEPISEKIVQYTLESSINAKVPTVKTDDTVINYGLFKKAEQDIATNKANVDKLLEKYEGKVDEYFTMNPQKLIIGAEGVEKTLEFETNIPLANITVTWDKPDKILLDLENKKFSSLLAPVEADYPIKAELTKSSSGQVLVELIFNYKEDGAQNSTSDYTKKDYITVTLMKDDSKMETNPTGAFTWLDDAVGMTMQQIMEFLGITPMVLSSTGDEKFKLNPNDYTKQANGTTADRPLGNDTVCKFPVRGIKRWKNGSVSFLSITDNPNAEAQGFIYTTFYYGNKRLTEFYLGAYDAYEANGKLYSYHDVAPKVNTTLTQFRNLAKARGTGYQLVDGYMIDYLQACYLMVHKSADCQTTVGMGISSGSAKVSGLADKFGMNNELATDSDKKSTTQAVKCLGIENLWGNVWTWVDGMYIDNVYRIKKSNNPDIFNDYGYGYKICGTGIGYGSSNGMLGNISDVAWNDELGFYPTSVQGGGQNKFYCDGLWQLSDKCASFGGCYADGLHVGVFFWYLYSAASTSIVSFGSRLAFKRLPK